MKAYGSRGEVFCSIRYSGGEIGGELSAIWRDGPHGGAPRDTRIAWSLLLRN